MNINIVGRRGAAFHGHPFNCSSICRIAVLGMAVLVWSSVAQHARGGEIHKAIEDGDTGKVRAVITADASAINETDKAGMTPLHLAVLKRRAAIVELLLECGANVEARTASGHAPLHLVGDRNIAVLLLNHKADVNVKVDRGPYGRGVTQLHQLAARNSVDVAAVLVAAGADVNAKDEDSATPLHQAAYNGNKEFVVFLLENKADVDVKDKSDLTPLHRAAAVGKHGVVRILLQHGADPDAKSSEGFTALHWTTTGSAKPDCEAVARLLLASGANLNATDNEGGTPLHWAVRNGQKAIVELLLANKAETNLKDGLDTTPLGWARLMQGVGDRTAWERTRTNHFREIEEILRRHGAKE